MAKKVFILLAAVLVFGLLTAPVSAEKEIFPTIIRLDVDNDCGECNDLYVDSVIITDANGVTYTEDVRVCLTPNKPVLVNTKSMLGLNRNEPPKMVKFIFQLTRKWGFLYIYERHDVFGLDVTNTLYHGHNCFGLQQTYKVGCADDIIIRQSANHMHTDSIKFRPTHKDGTFYHLDTM